MAENIGAVISRFRERLKKEELEKKAMEEEELEHRKGITYVCGYLIPEINGIIKKKGVNLKEINLSYSPHDIGFGARMYYLCLNHFHKFEEILLKKYKPFGWKEVKIQSSRGPTARYISLTLSKKRKKIMKIPGL